MKRKKWVSIAAAAVFGLSMSVMAMGCNVDDTHYVNEAENQTNQNNQSNQNQTNQHETNQHETNQNQTNQHETNQHETNQNQTNQHETNQNQTNQHETNQNQTNQNQGEAGALAEAHQLCAAAGRASGGGLTALHCFGPHDISGFEASNDSLTWQPGAFHIVAE